MAANILIATPQAEFGELLRLNIEESGNHNISIVNSGKDVMETANKIKFDLAILDPGLTDKPFVPLAQNLLDENPGLRLVVIQAQNRSKDPALDELSPHAYLSRPFYPPDLIEMIEGLLSISVAPPVPPQPEPETQPVIDLPSLVETTGLDPAPHDQTAIPSSSIVEVPGLTNELEELEKELSMMEGNQDKPAGQAEIDKLLAQLRASQTEDEPEAPQPTTNIPGTIIDETGKDSASQNQIDALLSGIAIDESLDQINSSTTEPITEERLGQMEQSPAEEEFLPPNIAIPSATVDSAAILKTPIYAGENLFIPNNELTQKHNELAGKYAMLAAEYSRLANEHAQLAAKHADLAGEKAEKDRENLARLKALDPIIEKLKQSLSNTTAHAAIIIRAGEIVAFAGNITHDVAHEIVRTIQQNWDADSQSDLVRFVRMNELSSEYMLYAMGIKDDFILGLIFDIAMPLSRMRSQTMQFSRALTDQPLVLLPTEMDSLSEYNDQMVIDLQSNLSQVPDPRLGNEAVIAGEWIPEEIVHESQNQSQAREILKDVLNQLEPRDESQRYEGLSLEEELISLYAQGPQDTHITAPVLPTPDDEIESETSVYPSDLNEKGFDWIHQDFESGENPGEYPISDGIPLNEGFTATTEKSEEILQDSKPGEKEGGEIFSSVLEQLINQTIMPTGISEEEPGIPDEAVPDNVNADDVLSDILAQLESQALLTSESAENGIPENEVHIESPGSPGAIFEDVMAQLESPEMEETVIQGGEIVGTALEPEAAPEEISAEGLYGDVNSLPEGKDESPDGSSEIEFYEAANDVIPPGITDESISEEFASALSAQPMTQNPQQEGNEKRMHEEGTGEEEQPITEELILEGSAYQKTIKEESPDSLPDDFSELQISDTQTESAMPELGTGDIQSEFQSQLDEMAYPSSNSPQEEIGIPDLFEEPSSIFDPDEKYSEMEGLEGNDLDPGFSEPDIDTILASVRSKLFTQDIPVPSDEPDFSSLIIESVRAELIPKKPKSPKSEPDSLETTIDHDMKLVDHEEREKPFIDHIEIEETPAVAPFLPQPESFPTPSNADQVLDDIFAQLESTEVSEGIPEEEASDQEYIFPWEQQGENKEESKEIPTQPIIISNLSHSVPEGTKNDVDIPTQPVRVATFSRNYENALNNVKANLVAVALQSRSNEQSEQTHAEEQMNSNGIEDTRIENGNDQKDTRSHLLSNLFYTCVLVPRFQEMQIEETLEQLLSTLLPQICLVFGWILEKVEIKSNYLLWAVQVNPAVSPGNLIRVIRKRTSHSIFEKYPQQKTFKYNEDFWAPGYLVVSGIELLDEKTLDGFIQQTYRRQNLLKSPNQ